MAGSTCRPPRSLRPNSDHPLLRLLFAAPHTEALAESSGWALPKVLVALTELEMQGRAVAEGGRWFARLS